MPTGIATLLLIVVNIFFTYRGLRNQIFFDGYKFEVDKILVKKDYLRLLTSGFLHVSWQHLVFNIMSLWFFSGGVEGYLGPLAFLVIYFAGMLGGDVLSLIIHRNHGDYSSVGASGAICGVIFASIALFPGMGIQLFGIIPFPGWLYGLAYVLYSIYGIRSKRDNIGHEAHLGGALAGLLVALLFMPSAFLENWITILVIVIPSLVFMYLIIRKPGVLLVDNFFFNNHQDFYSIDHRYNAEKNQRQKELDRLLDKIHRTGMDSLTKTEKAKLEEYSKSV